MDWANIQKTYIIPWQRQWHAILDRELGDDVDFDWRKSLGDMGGDFRSQFSTWDLSEGALEECFHILPSGGLFFKRVKQYLDDDGRLLGDFDVDGGLKIMREAISAINGLDGHSLDTGVSIHSLVGDRDLNGWSALEEFRDSWKCTDEYSAPQYWAATSFLREMLYRLGGNSFEVRDWVLWAFADDPDGRDPFSFLMRLTQNGVYEIEKPEGEITLFFTNEAGKTWK